MDELLTADGSGSRCEDAALENRPWRRTNVVVIAILQGGCPRDKQARRGGSGSRSRWESDGVALPMAGMMGTHEGSWSPCWATDE